MRLNYVKQFVFIIAISCLMSCATTAPDSSVTQEQTPKKPSFDFALESQKLYEKDDWNLFLVSYELNAPKYPELAESVWTSAVACEFSRWEKALESGKLREVLFRYYNVRVLAKSEPEKIQIDDKLIAYLESKDYPYLLASMKARLKSKPIALGKKNYDLGRLEDILAKVTVQIRYKTEEGIVRKGSEVFASAFLIDDRHLLTNYHAIKNTNLFDIIGFDIKVKLNGKEYGGAVLKGYDCIYDLAVIELPEPVSTGFNLLEYLGDSGQLKTGETIYCSGQHLGYDNTLTMGIVSGLKRKAFDGGYWIQTDAEISPGASGGPVFNSKGQIVGVNVASYYGESLSFVIPMSSALEVIDQLKEGQTLYHPWLGVSPILTSDGSIVLDYLYPSSALYGSIAISEYGAILLEINDKKIGKIEDAQDILIAGYPGNIFKLKLSTREGEKVIYVSSDSHPLFSAFSATGALTDVSNFYLHFGVELAGTITASTSIRWGKDLYSVSFRKVVRVRPDSPMANLGVCVGDSIGIALNEFDDRNHELMFLHLPKDTNIETIKNLNEYSFYMTKDAYDSNAF